jgi:hypothetical protein
VDDFTVYKRNHHGEVVWRYTGQVAARGETWVCLRAFFAPLRADLGFVIFQRGDLFIEWFFSDRWYNIFQVHAGVAGPLKGWYCNITRPADIADDWVAADDLALDIFVLPDGAVLLLDQDEFDQLGLSQAERMATLNAVQEIRNAVAARQPPFDRIGLL